MALETRFLTEVGGSNIDMDVNGSVTPVVFELRPVGTSSFNDTVRLFRRISLSIQLVDGTTVEPGNFGELTELVNGCVLRATNDFGTVDLRGGQPFKLNADFRKVGFASETNPGELKVEYPLDALELRSDLNAVLEFVVQDNLIEIDRLQILAKFDSVLSPEILP